MLFASCGHQVRIYDSFPAALAAAPTQISEKLKALEEKEQLRGNLKADQQIGLISCEYKPRAKIASCIF